MKYPLSMRLLHWFMAVVILGMVWAGWTMVSMDDHVPAKFELFYPWHKSFGMLVLFLVLGRLTLRARSSIPPLPAGLSPWETKASRAAHVALYALMIAGSTCRNCSQRTIHVTRFSACCTAGSRIRCSLLWHYMQQPL